MVPIPKRPTVRYSVIVFCFLFLCTPGEVFSSSPGSPDTIIAQVLGRRIGISEMPSLPHIITGSLLEKFADEQHIVITDAEIAQCTSARHNLMTQRDNALSNREQNLKKKLAGKGLNAEERKKLEDELKSVRGLERSSSTPKTDDSTSAAAEADISRGMVRMWKINLLLYKKYGGRVAFQQLGVEPVDAYRDFLKDQEQKGRFTIMDPHLRTKFWRYFEDSSLHTFVPDDQKKSLLERPWWRGQ
jgi:hypothetical protein